MERGCALLGYAPIGNIGMLLLATRLRTAALLPGGHAVRLVTESRWLQLPLEVRRRPAKPNRSALSALSVQALSRGLGQSYKLLRLIRQVTSKKVDEEM